MTPDVDLPLPLQGALLREALTQQLIERPPLIEGFLHERMVVLIASDAGVGKSTIFIQLAVQAGQAQNVFGMFPCIRPLTVYYLMTERDVWEPLDRLRRLETYLPLNTTNLIIDAECVGLTLTSATHRQLILSRILSHAPDIVEIDPIYGFFEGGMAGDEVAIRVGRFCTVLMKQSPKPLGVLLGHHNIKNPKQPDFTGKMVERESPFYGSQFLKAYVSGYYDLSKNATGTFWRRKKDTYGVLQPDFRLVYDPLSGLSHAEVALETLDKRDRFRLFLQECAQAHKPFQAEDVLQAIPMTPRYLRALLKDSEFATMLKPVNGKIVTFEVLSTG